jgi:hypothetical protein
MPRSLIRGPQVKDESIEAIDLAKDSVITEKIKDGNVTCVKLESGLCDRLLSSMSPIGRIKLIADFPANTDFTIPGGLVYVPISFVERVAIYRNGQLLYNGDSAPVNDSDPTEVYPGSDNSKIRFEFPLRRGDAIQVITL